MSWSDVFFFLTKGNQEKVVGDSVREEQDSGLMQKQQQEITFCVDEKEDWLYKRIMATRQTVGETQMVINDSYSFSGTHTAR